MTETIRDVVKLQNNILAAIRNAGEAGVPLSQVLTSVTGNTPPKGNDYHLADNLRKAGLIATIKNLPRGALTAYATNGKAAVTPAAKPKRRSPRHKVASRTGVLLTVQYGRNESVTLSFDEARVLYNQLAAMFGG